MSNEKKYTPGPLACRHSDGLFLPRIYDNKGRCIAIFKSLKNANDLDIFAAAPELLEALEKCVKEMNEIRCPGGIDNWLEIQDCIEYSMKLIAKAKGGIDE